MNKHVVGVIAAAVMYMLWWVVLGVRVELVPSGSNFWLGFVVFVVAFVVHEAIHYLLLPAGERALSWQGVAVQMTFHGELSPSRARVVAVAPFVVLSLLPLVYYVTLGTLHYWFVFVSIWNALVSGNDLRVFMKGE